MVKKFINLKQKILKIMKKTGLDEYVHDFSIDYDADDILDIHNYLMKKNDIVEQKCLDLLKGAFLQD